MVTQVAADPEHGPDRAWMLGSEGLLLGHEDAAEDLAGLRVLCVDNEAAILEGLGALLRGWGCETRLAAGYSEAVKACEGFDLDVALVDLHLDGPETGLDILAALDIGARDCRAAIITADPSPDAARETRRLGADLVRKPVDPQRLRAFLASARAQPRARKSASTSGSSAGGMA
jgi:DNA-binding NtrC family response regulator